MGADILRIVAIEATFESLGVIAVMVLIRTFVPFTLERELSGGGPGARVRPRPRTGECRPAKP